MSKKAPADGQFTLTLDKVLAGSPNPASLVCTYTYTYDFYTLLGSANVVSIGGTDVDFYMFPMGIEGRLAFMANIEPGTEVNLSDGATVILYRALFDVVGESATAAMMLGKDGDDILVTQNWNTSEDLVEQSKKVAETAKSEA